VGGSWSTCHYDGAVDLRVRRTRLLTVVRDRRTPARADAYSAVHEGERQDRHIRDGLDRRSVVQAIAEQSIVSSREEESRHRRKARKDVSRGCRVFAALGSETH
jgi:hypothetical protein